MTLFLLLRCQRGIEKRYMNLSNPSTWQAVASAQTGQVCKGNCGDGERNSTSGRWNLKMGLEEQSKSSQCVISSWWY